MALPLNQLGLQRGALPLLKGKENSWTKIPLRRPESSSVLDDLVPISSRSLGFFNYQNEMRFQNKPKTRILIVDDQGFNIDALMIIMKYSIKLKDTHDICDCVYDGK